jgi:hypothetical protein
MGRLRGRTLSDIELYNEFDSSWGTEFTMWTKARVYFPVMYDGSEWCSSVSRNPDGIPTDHIGG